MEITKVKYKSDKKNSDIKEITVCAEQTGSHTYTLSVNQNRLPGEYGEQILSLLEVPYGIYGFSQHMSTLPDVDLIEISEVQFGKETINVKYFCEEGSVKNTSTIKIETHVFQNTAFHGQLMEYINAARFVARHKLTYEYKSLNTDLFNQDPQPSAAHEDIPDFEYEALDEGETINAIEEGDTQKALPVGSEE